jgi:hypothetical protein
MRIVKSVTLAALVGASAAANAWWGVGPFDGFGAGDMSFSMHTSARGYGYGSPYWGPYGYPYYAPVYVYGPYTYGYGAPPVVHEDQAKAAQEAFEVQQQAMAELQKNLVAQQQAAAEAWKSAAGSRTAWFDGPFAYEFAHLDAIQRFHDDRFDAMHRQARQERDVIRDAHDKRRDEMRKLRGDRYAFVNERYQTRD